MAARKAVAVKGPGDKEPKFNLHYRQLLADIVGHNLGRFKRLTVALSATYALMVAMLVISFFVGVFLILNGAIQIVGDDTKDGLTSLGAGGLDMVLLGLAKPVQRIRAIKNDRVQMFVLLSDYQIQTASALIWFKLDERDSILQAADRIRDLTLETVELIETHMGGEQLSPIRLQQDMLDRVAEQNVRLTERLTKSLDTEGVPDVTKVIKGTLRRSNIGYPKYV